MKTMEGIWELRRSEERRSGRKVEIYSAYPIVGRGSVVHDLVPHEEVERRFAKAMQVSIWERLRHKIDRIIARYV